MWGDTAFSFAQVGSNGMVLRFSADDFMVFPNKIAQWIIAHELAHVFQKATGRLPGGQSEGENEDDANRIAHGWGFDNTAVLMLKLLIQERQLSVEKAVRKIVKMGFV
jgi:hypothetical protein